MQQAEAENLRSSLFTGLPSAGQAVASRRKKKRRRTKKKKKKKRKKGQESDHRDTVSPGIDEELVQAGVDMHFALAAGGGTFVATHCACSHVPHAFAPVLQRWSRPAGLQNSPTTTVSGMI